MQPTLFILGLLLAVAGVETPMVSIWWAVLGLALMAYVVWGENRHD